MKFTVASQQAIQTPYNGTSVSIEFSVAADQINEPGREHVERALRDAFDDMNKRLGLSLRRLPVSWLEREVAGSADPDDGRPGDEWPMR